MIFMFSLTIFSVKIVCSTILFGTGCIMGYDMEFGKVEMALFYYLIDRTKSLEDNLNSVNLI
jgi:hypothetical protein